ncbi:hypothetical protein F5Y17DRAFT_192123 [Xylariaceae sp. FL0594]|nr:hypothetical protein F5Y17DRAFT_192123 [Xylariaceae sp. FL0594]
MTMPAMVRCRKDRRRCVNIAADPVITPTKVPFHSVPLYNEICSLFGYCLGFRVFDLAFHSTSHSCTWDTAKLRARSRPAEWQCNMSCLSDRGRNRMQTASCHDRQNMLHIPSSYHARTLFRGGHGGCYDPVGHRVPHSRPPMYNVTRFFSKSEIRPFGEINSHNPRTSIRPPLSHDAPPESQTYAFHIRPFSFHFWSLVCLPVVNKAAA